MMKKEHLSRLIAVLLICLCAPFAVDAQGRRQPGADLPTTGAPDASDEYRPPFRILPPVSRKGWYREYQPDSAEKRRLSVAPEDEKKFAEFLSQPNTGLFRLIPFRFRNPRIVSAADPEATTRPGFLHHASMYSFSKRKHGHGLNGLLDQSSPEWADLRLQNGVLSSGFTTESLGLLVTLGDVPLETVTALSAGVAEIANFALEVDPLEAARLSNKNVFRFKLKGSIYPRLPAVVDTTYALRSISNNRADILVSFRIVRQDEDGSLTILWKKLKSYPKPLWKRAPQR